MKNIDEMKKKKKITFSIDRNLLSKVDLLTTNKSFLIEKLLFKYAIQNGIKTNDIIL